MTATQRLWIADLLIGIGVYTLAGVSLKTFIGSVFISWGIALLVDA